MKIRENKILGVLQEGKYKDYEQALMHWEDAGNMNMISCVRNNERDDDLKGNDLIFCPYCEKPIRVKYLKGRKFPYFTHKNPKDASVCISEDKGQEELCKEIVRARKYEGRETGYLHNKSVKQLAEIITSLTGYTLLKDTEGKRLYHVNNSQNYRIPDVYFTYKNKKYVIEVQNSPEWVNAIAERHKFYYENNIILLWFLTENASLDNSVTASDISSRQKHNSFIFNDTCYSKSIEKKKLIFLCNFDEPVCEKINDKELKVIEIKQVKQISIDELSFDKSSVFYYDYDNEYKEIKCSCIIKNELAKRYYSDIDTTYYSHMFESACFAKYRKFPDHIKPKPIERLNTIAHDFVGMIYLYMALDHYKSLELAYEYDNSGKLKKKFFTGIDFWSSVKKNDFVKAASLFSDNQRTTFNTINGWKKTIKSNDNKFLEAFPELEEIPSKALTLIERFEGKIAPYLLR